MDGTRIAAGLGDGRVIFYNFIKRIEEKKAERRDAGVSVVRWNKIGDKHSMIVGRGDGVKVRSRFHFENFDDPFIQPNRS